MTIKLSLIFRYFLLCSFFPVLLVSCGYQRPAGQWIPIAATEVYFTGVELGDDAIDPSYKAVCSEAGEEISKQLIDRLPAKIAPLRLETTEKPADKSASAAVLTLTITDCEIDVDQSGGSFTYYLSLPVKVTVTQNNGSLLSYNMSTYEQVQVDQPGPEFEFTFAEPVERTLMMFNGRQLWLPE